MHNCDYHTDFEYPHKRMQKEAKMSLRCLASDNQYFTPPRKYRANDKRRDSFFAALRGSHSQS